MEDVNLRAATAVTDKVATQDSAYDQECLKLAKEVERAVQSATGGRVHKIEVEISEDTILLRGFCATFHCNQLAQTAAMDVAGDMPIDNQIVVW